MKSVKSLNPVTCDQAPPVHYLPEVKRTKSYPVIFHSRKRYAESEEEE